MIWNGAIACILGVGSWRYYSKIWLHSLTEHIPISRHRSQFGPLFGDLGAIELNFLGRSPDCLIEKRLPLSCADFDGWPNFIPDIPDGARLGAGLIGRCFG